MGYLDGQLDFENLRLEKGDDGLREYRQSKLADLLFVLEFQRRLVATHGQVQSLAAQPGANRTAWAADISPAYLAAAEGPPDGTLARCPDGALRRRRARSERG